MVRAQPQRHTSVKHAHLNDLNPEAIIFYPDNGGEKFQVLSDDGKRLVNGMPCKELADPRQQRFRSVWVTLKSGSKVVPSSKEPWRRRGNRIPDSPHDFRGRRQSHTPTEPPSSCQYSGAAAAAAGRAGKTMNSGLNCAPLQVFGRDVPEAQSGSWIFQVQVEHLIEVAIIQLAAVADAHVVRHIRPSTVAGLKLLASSSR